MWLEIMMMMMVVVAAVVTRLIIIMTGFSFRTSLDFGTSSPLVPRATPLGKSPRLALLAAVGCRSERHVARVDVESCFRSPQVGACRASLNTSYMVCRAEKHQEATGILASFSQATATAKTSRLVESEL